MFISRMNSWWLLAIAVAGLGMPCAVAQKDTDIVAEVGGINVTRSDFQRVEASKLLQARFQFYQAESKALDDLIDKKLLEQKAKREGLTVDQLIDRDIKAQVKDPTDEQMKVFYEGLETDQPYDAVREKILEKIRQVRTEKARAAYLKELRAESEVHVVLAGPTASVNVGNANWLGPKSAPVLVVEFADYECPYCQRVAPDIERLLGEYGSKVAFVYKDFPLPMHAHAEKAAEAARCAATQGRFWQFHDQLFHSKELDVDELKSQARMLGLNSPSFEHCLDSGEQSAAVAQDRSEGVDLGLSGTPSFFVNGHYFSGALDYTALRQLVEQQLSAPKTEMTAQK